MSSYSTTVVETPSDSLLSAILKDMSSHNSKAMQSTPDTWVSTPMVAEERGRQKQRRQARLNRYSSNQFSPAAVSKPIAIPGAQEPLYMTDRYSFLPKNHPFTDHKVHCYKDNVTDYCRRDSNGWEPMRQKRRESIEANVGKILDGSWELLAHGSTQHQQKNDRQVRENGSEEIERYLKGETNLLGYLRKAREEMGDEDEDEYYMI